VTYTEKDGAILVSLSDFISRDFVLLLKDIKHNHPSFLLAKNGEYTAFMMNYVPMIAQK